MKISISLSVEFSSNNSGDEEVAPAIGQIPAKHDSVFLNHPNPNLQNTSNNLENTIHEYSLMGVSLKPKIRLLINNS